MHFASVKWIITSLAPQDDDSSSITTFKRTVKKKIEERWELNDLKLFGIVSSTWPTFQATLREPKLKEVKIELIERLENLPSPDDCDNVENPPPLKKPNSAFDILLGEENESTSIEAGGSPELDEV